MVVVGEGRRENVSPDSSRLRHTYVHTSDVYGGQSPGSRSVLVLHPRPPPFVNGSEQGVVP